MHDDGLDYDDRGPNAMVILRWLLVLPAAFVAATVVLVVVNFLNAGSFTIPGMDLAVRSALFFLAGFVFVIAGASVAPNRRGVVAIALALVIAVYWVRPLIDTFARPMPIGPWEDIATTASSVAGAILAAAYMARKAARRTANSPR